jgi:lysophospholipase L1-like esterase
MQSKSFSKKTRILILTSVCMNLVFLIFFSALIINRGGFSYLKKRFGGSQTESIIPHTNTSYYRTKISIHEILPVDSSSIIFFGNSITDYCEWHELFGDAQIKNRGISGDLISGALRRIDPILEGQPKKIFLMLGTNDLGEGREKKEILSDYETIVQKIVTASPKTSVYLQSVLPTYDDSVRKNADIITLNKGIQKIAEQYNLIYINLFDLLVNEKNELDKQYSFDGLHINGTAYLIWKNAIEEYLRN